MTDQQLKIERERAIADAVERLGRCNGTMPGWTEINIKLELGRDAIVKVSAKIDKPKTRAVK